MLYRRISYGNEVTVEIETTDNVKIPDVAINKALMIAMNYLLENLETSDQEEPE